MVTVGHPTAPRRRTVQQWRQHAASRPCCVGCRRGGGDSAGAGAAVRASGGNGASSGASSTAAERGGGPTDSCRPPWEGKGSAAGILCHSQRRVQRQQQRRLWGGGAVGIVPPHESSAHGSGGASEGEVGEARALRQRTGPLLPRSGCRCVEMALQQGGGHAHWGHRVSVRVAVKRQAMQETASATSKRFKTWTVAKWRVEARGEEPFNRRQENPASPPFS